LKSPRNFFPANQIFRHWAALSATNVLFTATAIGGSVLEDLTCQLAENEWVVSGWDFSTSGYTVSSTTPVYLSFKVGAVANADNLQLWHYDGSVWTEFDAFDWTYDGVYASFTAESFSGYAVSVPEPGMAVLLLASVLGLAGCVWRKRK